MTEESPMENLTLAMKVVKPHTIDPLEGHTVVIFETVGDAGEEYRFEIEPGQTRPKTKLNLFEWARGRKAPNYFAYAVTGLPELRWTFTTDVVLDIQAHTFTLLVTLSYSVSEPRLLVIRRNDDPIRKVRDYIADVLTRAFAQRRWSEIRHDFRLVEREIVKAALDSLRQFAAYFGIRIHDLWLNHRLQKIDFDEILAEEDAAARKAAIEREAEVARTSLVQTAQTKTLEQNLGQEAALRGKEHEHELASLGRSHALEGRPQEAVLEGYRRADRISDAYVEAAVTALTNAGSAIRTPDELMQTLDQIRGAAEQLHALGEGSAPIARGFIAARNSGQSGAAAVIGEVLIETERMGLLLAQKQKLQSAILHLIAELLLDGAGNATIIDEYAKRIEDIRAEPRLAMEYSDYLKKFVDPNRLRESLL
jgi:hypothetical protein